MAKTTIAHKPDLTAADAVQLFAARFPDCEVYETMLLGADFVVKRSAFTGVSVKLIQKKDKTIFRYGGFAPSIWARLLLGGLIMLLILHFTSWKRITAEVKEFLETSPVFQESGAGEPGQEADASPGA